MAADFNSDGNLDLATGNSINNTVNVLMGNEDGTFSNEDGTLSRADIPVGVAPFSIVAGDFDGDGNLELATANTAANNVSVLFGQ